MQPFVQPQKRLSGKRLFSVISSKLVKLLYENPTHFSLRIQSSLVKAPISFNITHICKQNIKVCCECLITLCASIRVKKTVDANSSLYQLFYTEATSRNKVENFLLLQTRRNSKPKLGLEPRNYEFSVHCCNQLNYSGKKERLL